MAGSSWSAWGPRPCRHIPACPAASGTHARRVVGLAPIHPVSGRPSALRSHAPDAAGPALRANDGNVTTGPRGRIRGMPGIRSRCGAAVRGRMRV
ncbi:hypothetical protein EST54_17740 [Streptomyces sioyaensis]|uniref:Uncharacterized protein n=1 Tax=Streptomyces sioyaensis TaxID=67364 RepID=A0A4Q1R1I3_9ACTN|nr:hypothetical protein EST54_17740 [Streptomyces sioyaensis]